MASFYRGRLAATTSFQTLKNGLQSQLPACRSRRFPAVHTPSMPLVALRYSDSTRAAMESAPKFSYDIAASFIAKDRPFNPSSHVFHFDPYNRIRPPRHRRPWSRPDSGHDAFFVSRVNETGAIAFGVADGVGGWVDSGVDPADFSHGFCDYMAAAAYEFQSEYRPPLTARGLMEEGFAAICRDGNVRAGGSTACVAIAQPNGLLDVANLGDSGFLHLRLSAVHAYSEPQTHAFNTPFQLSIIPPGVAARMAAFGGTQLCDLPRDADLSLHKLQHGDVLVFATDGVLDNLFNQEILRIASKIMVNSGAWKMESDKGVHVAESLNMLIKPSGGIVAAAVAALENAERAATLQSLLATEIVKAAKMASINTKRDGPFAKEVEKYFPQEKWHGGKVDDICVIVVVVSRDSASAKARL